MRNIVLAVGCAAGLGFATVAAQNPAQQNQPGQDQQQQQQQQTQQSQSQDQQKQMSEQSVTLTGCVYQASDQPMVFALRGAGDGQQAQSGQQSAQSGQQGAQSAQQGAQSGQQSAQSGQQGAQSGQQGAQSGQQSAETGTTGTTGMKDDMTGAWFRLAPGAGQDLKEYTGQHVRVNGTVKPGQDEKGADVVIHRLMPDRTVVTAVDLKPAPVLSISSITPADGSCDQASSR